MTQDRYSMQPPVKGELIRADLLRTIVEAVKGTGVPEQRGTFESSAEHTVRSQQRHKPKWFAAKGEAPAYSILEVYTGEMMPLTGELVLHTREWTGDPKSVLAVNEEFLIDPDNGGYCKLVVPGEPYKVRCNELVEFDQIIGPSATYPYIMSMEGEGFARLCEALITGQDVSWVIQRIVETSDPTDPPPPGGGTGCCCDKDNCPRGVDVLDATVCCKTHPEWNIPPQAYGGAGILVEDGPDNWVSEEPFDGEICEYGTTPAPSTTAGADTVNKYKWRMTPSHSPWGSTLEAELFEDNGCPVACILYRSPAPFECQCTNEFVRTEAWGTVDISRIPYRLCITPIPAPLVPPTPSCIQIDEGTVVVPSRYSLNVSGAEGACQYVHGGSAHFHTLVFSANWTSSCPPDSTSRNKFNINKDYVLYTPDTLPGGGGQISGNQLYELGACASLLSGYTACTAWYPDLSQYVGEYCTGGFGSTYKREPPRFRMTMYAKLTDPDEVLVRFVFSFAIPTFAVYGPFTNEGAMYVSSVITIDRHTDTLESALDKLRDPSWGSPCHETDLGTPQTSSPPAPAGYTIEVGYPDLETSGEGGLVVPRAQYSGTCTGCGHAPTTSTTTTTTDEPTTTGPTTTATTTVPPTTTASTTTEEPTTTATPTTTPGGGGGFFCCYKEDDGTPAAVCIQVNDCAECTALHDPPGTPQCAAGTCAADCPGCHLQGPSENGRC